ncbi:XAC0095 family protein [Xanthomonas hortorum]|uniref:XAC0095-like domain-containing protein n=1 Tax=Xanthomonas hortorum pv. hederae TaxID=453603 RepID=A0A9X4BSG1_9XANT|nr:hypothetical protein [Xanthomonas hortorum]MCE4369738.1 hypothetical protein [Xanthomonas hortorum pv. hederae]MDC8638753.1 hypothetical protein [Xanthomonas hortorum pv. hederae]PPU86271.1 hypothetical protein XhhCFBP4925_00660 [Xanthomonas hortorum pv. hederae]PUF01398.1 hypothetical protein C7T87_03530 [Xanthomonas hortorum pv. hederae]
METDGIAGAAGLGYWMGDEAQYRLEMVRDQLRLLAALARPRSVSDGQVAGLPLSYAELSHCFATLGEQLGAVLAELAWPARLDVEGARAPPPTALPGS